MGETIRLSKSKYCMAVQCPKSLWMQLNKPEEAADVSNDAVLANGTRVGEIARKYFGDSTLVEYDADKRKMIAETARLIDAGEENIAEASFLFDDLYCAVDILHRDGDGFDIVEVKSSTEVSEIYVEDVSFQYYVLKNSGISVKKAYILCINSSYVRTGELNLKELFRLEDHTEAAKERFAGIKARIKDIRGYVSSKTEPARSIGSYCLDPYECPFKAYCWKNIPKPSVFDISGMQKKTMFSYYDQGIVSFADIVKKKVKLTDKKQMQVDYETKNLPDHIDKEALKDFLDTLRYPLYHLDFETFQQAIPEFDGLSPYEQIPFQYSLHIEYEDGRLEHKEFLAKEGTDPRRAIAESLCRDIPRGACLLAYNFSFEKRVLSTLSKQFPDLKTALMDMHDNMLDLMVPFQKGYYYTKAMQGRYTIKYVLPALFPDDPELDYHNLSEVHNGSEASAAFLTMPQKSPEEIASLRANLLKYCGLDTYAMVKVLAKIREVKQ